MPPPVDTVIKTIVVSTTVAPEELVYIDDHTLFVTLGSQLVVVDPIAGTTHTRISVGPDPLAVPALIDFHTIVDAPGTIADGERDRRIFVATGADVTVISVPLMAVVHTFTPPEQVGFIADGNNGRFVYLAAAQELIVFDGVRGAIVGSIALGHAPNGIAVSLDGHRIYVAHPDDNLLSIVDTTTAFPSVTSIPVPHAPFAVSLSPDGGRLYIVQFGPPQVGSDRPGFFSVLDLSTMHLTTVGVGSSPAGCVGTTTRAYVRNLGGGISVIDTSTATPTTIQTIATNAPTGIAINADGSRVFVSNFTSRTVTVISASG
jgi:hypothetical protein